MLLSDVLYQAFLVVFVLYIFGNPQAKSTSKGEIDSWPWLLWSQGAHVFFNRETMTTWVQDKTGQTDIEQLLCTFPKCLIEMMTCVAGKARCQEKAALEKCPSNQTYILYNHDTCSVQASRRFLIWLKESCQDYYRRVSATHLNATPLFPVPFAFVNCSAENEEGTDYV